MRYYVIGDDGNKYGPSDVAGLNQWIQEGRLLPTTLLEEEASGARVAAAAVQGLIFPTVGPQTGAPQTPGVGATGRPVTSGPYAQQNPYEQSRGYNAAAAGGDDGQTFVILSWVFGGIGFATCFCFGWTLPILGLVFGAIANGKGNPNAKAPLIFNGVTIALGLVVQFLILPMLAVGFLKGMQNSPNLTPQQRQQIQQSLNRAGSGATGQ